MRQPSAQVSLDADLEREVNEVFQDPVQWLNTPNDQFGGRKPIDLIEEGRGQFVWDLIQMIKHGMVT